MIALLRRYLRPYATQLTLALILLTFVALTNLYLPELNADIINNGVVKGDNAYIIQTGAIMLVVTLAMGLTSVAAVFFSARAREVAG